MGNSGIKSFNEVWQRGEAIPLPDGTILEAELHWYEAHGIGKKEIKLKKPVIRSR